MVANVNTVDKTISQDCLTDTWTPSECPQGNNNEIETNAAGSVSKSKNTGNQNAVHMEVWYYSN